MPGNEAISSRARKQFDLGLRGRTKEEVQDVVLESSAIDDDLLTLMIGIMNLPELISLRSLEDWTEDIFRYSAVVNPILSYYFYMGLSYELPPVSSQIVHRILEAGYQGTLRGWHMPYDDDRCLNMKQISNEFYRLYNCYGDIQTAERPYPDHVLDADGSLKLLYKTDGALNRVLITWEQRARFCFCIKYTRIFRVIGEVPRLQESKSDQLLFQQRAARIWAVAEKNRKALSIGDYPGELQVLLLEHAIQGRNMLWMFDVSRSETILGKPFLPSSIARYVLGKAPLLWSQAPTRTRPIVTKAAWWQSSNGKREAYLRECIDSMFGDELVAAIIPEVCWQKRPNLAAVDIYVSHVLDPWISYALQCHINRVTMSETMTMSLMILLKQINKLLPSHERDGSADVDDSEDEDVFALPLPLNFLPIEELSAAHLAHCPRLETVEPLGSEAFQKELWTAKFLHVGNAEYGCEALCIQAVCDVISLLYAVHSEDAISYLSPAFHELAMGYIDTAIDLIAQGNTILEDSLPDSANIPSYIRRDHLHTFPSAEGDHVDQSRHYVRQARMRAREGEQTSVADPRRDPPTQDVAPEHKTAHERVKGPVHFAEDAKTHDGALDTRYNEYRRVKKGPRPVQGLQRDQSTTHTSTAMELSTNVSDKPSDSPCRSPPVNQGTSGRVSPSSRAGIMPSGNNSQDALEEEGMEGEESMATQGVPGESPIGRGGTPPDFTSAALIGITGTQQRGMAGQTQSSKGTNLSLPRSPIRETGINSTTEGRMLEEESQDRNTSDEPEPILWDEYSEALTPYDETMDESGDLSGWDPYSQGYMEYDEAMGFTELNQDHGGMDLREDDDLRDDDQLRHHFDNAYLGGMAHYSEDRRELVGSTTDKQQERDVESVQQLTVPSPRSRLPVNEPNTQMQDTGWYGSPLLSESNDIIVDDNDNAISGVHGSQSGVEPPANSWLATSFVDQPRSNNSSDMDLARHHSLSVSPSPEHVQGTQTGLCSVDTLRTATTRHYERHEAGSGLSAQQNLRVGEKRKRLSSTSMNNSPDLGDEDIGSIRKRGKRTSTDPSLTAEERSIQQDQGAVCMSSPTTQPTAAILGRYAPIISYGDKDDGLEGELKVGKANRPPAPKRKAKALPVNMENYYIPVETHRSKRHAYYRNGNFNEPTFISLPRTRSDRVLQKYTESDGYNIGERIIPKAINRSELTAKILRENGALKVIEPDVTPTLNCQYREVSFLNEEESIVSWESLAYEVCEKTETRVKCDGCTRDGRPCHWRTSTRRNITYKVIDRPEDSDDEGECPEDLAEGASLTRTTEGVQVRFLSAEVTPQRKPKTVDQLWDEKLRLLGLPAETKLSKSRRDSLRRAENRELVKQGLKTAADMQKYVKAKKKKESRNIQA
ncbi:hypothetical protein CALCODRAFT_509369 [Calocera cornea HHB12733]|uniref:Uncharacterized protein n=1 Tax=Calocera cornea HHB12733 TaxID=1353952 RepID=A0A165FDQ8_9BASI|nr:hypothetical protein CALCODRAFT_509369 [Calocera cornea HHB12733]